MHRKELNFLTYGWNRFEAIGMAVVFFDGVAEEGGVEKDRPINPILIFLFAFTHYIKIFYLYRYSQTQQSWT